MSYLQPKEQALYDAAKAALPRWLFSNDANQQELIAAFAKQFAQVWDQADFWCDQIFITRAFGLWLDQHARDSGTYRQGTESDATLATRLRAVEPSVTKQAMLDTANTILQGAGILTPAAAMVELRKDHAYFRPAGGAYRAFMSRGYRMAASKSFEIILILPYGTPSDVAASIQAALELKKAGGIIVREEVRANP